MNYSPIALFCYNRPLHLKRTVEALLMNPEAKESCVHFFSDAAAKAKDQAKVTAVRSYIRSVSGFKEIFIHEAEANMGLSNAVIKGVSSILEKEQGIIVLEDDMECQPFFLNYMNEALTKYAQEEKVISIHAYSYPVPDLPDSFFLKGADCWGWATWPRGWKLFEEDGKKLLDELRAKGLVRRLDYNGSYPFHRMLQRQVKGVNQSWAVRWYASALLQDKLTLYPGKSLLRNTGNDNSGTHSKRTSIYEPLLADKLPALPATIEESQTAFLAFSRFFKKARRRAILEKLGLKNLF